MCCLTNLVHTVYAVCVRVPKPLGLWWQLDEWIALLLSSLQDKVRNRLLAIRCAIEESAFFQTHEVRLAYMICVCVCVYANTYEICVLRMYLRTSYFIQLYCYLVLVAPSRSSAHRCSSSTMKVAKPTSGLSISPRPPPYQRRCQSIIARIGWKGTTKMGICLDSTIWSESGQLVNVHTFYVLCIKIQCRASIIILYLVFFI